MNFSGIIGELDQPLPAETSHGSVMWIVEFAPAKL